MIAMTKAQETADEKSDFNTSIGIVNRFVWRGIFLDSKPNIQPALTYTKSGFTVGAWGSYNLTAGYAQTNFFANYTVKGFTLQVMDHYIGRDTVNINYFDYGKTTTNHVFESSLKYTYKKFSFLASTFFYGNDRNADDESNFSSYAEIGYNLPVKNTTFDFFVGTALNEGIYANKFAVVSAGLKMSRTIKINDKFTLPVGFTIVSNPDTENMFFIIECTIR